MLLLKLEHFKIIIMTQHYSHSIFDLRIKWRGEAKPIGNEFAILHKHI